MKNYLQFKTLGSAFLLFFLFAFMPKTSLAGCDFSKGIVTASVNAICVGESVTLTHSGFEYAAGFQWQESEDGGAAWTDITGATASTYVASPIVTTQYRMKMYNNDDFCGDYLDTYYTTPVTISVNEGSGGNNAGEGSEVEICATENEVDLNDLFSGGDTGGTYSYPANEGLITSSIFDISSLANGTHSVFYMVGGSCGSDTAESIITILGVPNSGDDTELTTCSTAGEIQLMDLFPTADIGGSFSYPADESLINDVTFDISELLAGEYTVFHTITNNCGTSTAELVLTIVNPESAGDDASLTVCANQEFDLSSLLGANASENGVWYDYNQNILTSSTVIAAEEDGDYAYTYVIPEGYCAGNLATFTITVSAMPSYAGENATLEACSADGAIELDGLFPGSDANGTFSYPADESLITNSTFDISSLAAGSYTVLHLVSTDCSEDQAEVVITISNSANAGADADLTVCKNEPFDLSELLDQNADAGGVWSDANGVLTSTEMVSANTGGVSVYMYTVENADCPEDVATFTITVDGDCDYLSVNDEIFAHISIFPNPTSNVVNFTNLDKEFNAEVVDLNGRVVLTKTLNANASTISLEKFESGIYSLRIFNNEGQKVMKIIKR